MKGKFGSWFLLLAVFATCVLIFVTYRYSREELTVDRCLSAYHGSFNYSNMTCDLETNHPYVPYQVRHPLDKWVVALALVCFVPFLSDYYHKRTDYKDMNSK
jgi:hypothetical protein